MNITPAALLATIRINLMRRPLMHPSVAEECLDLSRFKLNALIESGELPWAWNLGNGPARKEIRILAHSVIPLLVHNCTIHGYGSVYLVDEPRV